MRKRGEAVCAQMNIGRLLDRRIFHLSSGEKQLIALASICAMEPKVIVMDEPSANLDSDAMARLGALLYRLKAAGHTIILSEHRFHYVRDSFDRLIFMEDGAISAIYGHDEALKLPEKQLTAMGLRPFGTPASMFIDRSTMKYRLQKIGDLLGADTDDPATARRLQLAIAVHRLRGKLAATEG